MDWDEYCMAVTFLAAKRSSDPKIKVGACIVNEKERKIVGIGCNEMPYGCSDYPWDDEGNDLQTKFFYVAHAEMNAILNTNSVDVKGCAIYVTLFPCSECAKMIIQSGIKEVIYISDKNYHQKKTKTIASRNMFKSASVECRKYEPKYENIVINFSEINWY